MIPAVKKGWDDFFTSVHFFASLFLNIFLINRVFFRFFFEIRVLDWTGLWQESKYWKKYFQRLALIRINHNLIFLHYSYFSYFPMGLLFLRGWWHWRVCSHWCPGAITSKVLTFRKNNIIYPQSDSDIMLFWFIIIQYFSNSSVFLPRTLRLFFWFWF